MADDPKIRSAEEKATKQTMFETIIERVHRHLRDIHSKITDDDVRNSRIELEANPEIHYGELLNR